MKLAEKHTYSFFFLALSLLSLNFSMLAMKKQFPNDNKEVVLEKSDSIFYKRTFLINKLFINQENKKCYLTLLLVMRSYSFDIPKELIKKVLKISITHHQINDNCTWRPSYARSGAVIVDNFLNTINWSVLENK